MVLHGHLCQLFAGHLVLVHVVGRDHRVQAGECRADKPFPLAVCCAGEGIGACAGLDIGHLLDARCDNDIFHAACNRDDGLPEGKTARCTGRLDPGRGDVAGCHARVVRDEGTDVFLLDEPAGTHVADIHCIDLLARELGILKGKGTCLDKEVAERPLPVLAELRASDTDHCYVSHTCITSFPLCFAYCA